MGAALSLVQQKIIYLACPYAHADNAVQIRRTNASRIVAAQLRAEGFAVFAPISDFHAARVPLPAAFKTHEFCMAMDKLFFDLCTEVLVLPMEGWHLSKGVMMEMDWAIDQGKPVRFYDMNKLTAVAGA